MPWSGCRTRTRNPSSREGRDRELHVARDSPERWWKGRPDQDDDRTLAIRRINHGLHPWANVLPQQTAAGDCLGSGAVPVRRVARLVEVGYLPAGVRVREEKASAP